MFLISFLHTVSFLVFALPLAVTQYWKHSVFHGSHQVWHLLYQGGRGRTGEEEKNIYSLFYLRLGCIKYQTQGFPSFVLRTLSRLCYPPWVQKRGGLDSSGPRLVSSKIREQHFFVNFLSFTISDFLRQKKHDFSDFFFTFSDFLGFLGTTSAPLL